MSIYSYGWCKVEGSVIPDLKAEYNGAFSQLSNTTNVFYGSPEITINNPTIPVNGVAYKVVPISEFGYSTILNIDSNYSSLISQISTYDKTVNLEDPENSAQYFYEPFTISESSVIFYCDSTHPSFDHYSIVLVDEFATPNIITIIASYSGRTVPVGDAFNDETDLDINAIYSDGSRAKIVEGYTISPEDQIVTQVGSNVFIVSYVTPDNETYNASIVVEGIKKLTGVTAYYDGPNVAYEQEALKKYFIVVAEYSDGSSATVTNFTFPNGNIVSETNAGVIAVYYSGFYTSVSVPLFTVSTARLIAYYNGPNVEVGYPFDFDYCNIKIYYTSEDEINNYYDDIDPENCTFPTTIIDHEGINYITVLYEGKTGSVSTVMVVLGVIPEVTLNFIEAIYTGPDIYVGSSFSAERVICKAHYSDGTIVSVKNFTLNSNVVNYVGLNEYNISYTETDTTVTTTISVNGVDKDSTSESGYSPIYLDNNYPEATRLNHRYRGPAEADKFYKINQMLYLNIVNLYQIFSKVEKDFNNSVVSIERNAAIKTKILNETSGITKEAEKWITDSRFSSGEYILEEDN